MLRSLRHYWRTHLAVALGAAVAAAVLTGALLVGDSVRGSLRDLTLDSLGSIDWALLGERPFRRQLGADLARELGWQEAPASLLLVRGVAVHGESRARASGVAVLGTDSRFAELYPESPALDFSRAEGQLFPSVFLSRTLAEELGAGVGEPVVISFERPAEIPRETLIGRQEADDTIETLRLSVKGIVPDRGPGGFRLTPHQSRPLNALVEIDRLQRALFGRGEAERANVVLAASPPGDDDDVSDALDAALQRALALDDVGLTLVSAAGHLTVQSREFVLNEPLARAVLAGAERLGAATQPVLTYLANSLGAGGRTVPYSTISALEPATAPALGPFRLIDGAPAAALAEDEILLNAWAAEDLGVQTGDEIEVTYFVVGPRDELATESARFRLAGIVAMEGLAVDRTLTPEFPGIHQADNISAWDPPFPVELDRVRPRDEEYWDLYGAAPKAFVSEATGRRLWKSRFGELTSIRLAPPPGVDPTELEERLRQTLPAALDAAADGLSFRQLRREGLDAAKGATDFAGLFFGLSLFLIASAAMLVGLLFGLGVEQRAREIGLLRALGYRARSVRRRLLAEGALLAALGSLLGLAGAVFYAWLLLAGLRSWWLPAIGAPVLFLHVRPLSLALGWAISMAVVLLAVWIALRRLRRVPTPSLLAGATAVGRPAAARKRALGISLAAMAAAVALLAVDLAGGSEASPALALGIGACVLVAGLAFFAHWSGGGRRRANALGGATATAALLGMGARNSGRNPGRSLLSVALVACACFMIVAVAANRAGGEPEVGDRASGAGGFTLVAESDVPFLQDLDSTERRAELGIPASAAAAFEGVDIVPFRLLPGDDVSCLNLYRPERPRLLGVPPEMIRRGGFSFRQTIEPSDNPWELLELELEPGVIPAIGDYNSVLWILHSGLGKDLVVQDESGAALRLRLVALLTGSLFQSEILISEESFRRHFPGRAGYSFFLADPPPPRAAAVREALETGLERFGLDVSGTAERLEAFKAVEHTYLSTFQTLGGLGLVFGTLGLGIVLLRNILERRGELATLRAFGFRRSTLAWMVLAENSALLALGVIVGTVAGMVAVAPTLIERGGELPWFSLTATLLLVLGAGMLSSVAAVAGSLRTPLLPSLKAE